MPAFAQEKIKACFLYVGSKTDGGWTQAHDVGRQLVDKELGDKVETSFLENVAEGPDAERAIERLRALRLRDRLHDVVRLHGPDGRRRREVPGREVRACDRATRPRRT